MVKEKRILSYILGWLLIGFIIMFVGVNKIFAATYYMNYNYQQQYYDNRGSSVNQISTSWNDSLNSYVSGNITTVSNSYGAGLSITSPIPLLGGHTYSMSVYFEDITNIALSSKNEISVASSLSAAANDYANNIPGTEMLYSKVSNNTILQFVFKVNNNHTHLFFPWTTTSTTTQTYVLTQVVMEDLGSSGITENEINNSLNNQTNELNESIQNSTDTITGEIDDMEQAIIDSNKETQEVIKDQFNSCRDSYNLLKLTDGTYSSSGLTAIVENGVITINGTSTATSFLNIPIKQLDINEIFSVSLNNTSMGDNSSEVRFQLSGSNYINIPLNTSNNKVQNIQKFGTYTGFLVRISSGVTITNGIIKPMINEGSTAKEYEPYGEEICTNKIDDTNNKLEDIQGALTDTSTPNLEILGDSAGWLPAGPLDSVLNLPLTMMNNLLTNLGKTCSTLRVELPFVNKNIEIPCIESLMEKMGALVLWRWVGRIASVIILYSYLMNLYAWADKILTLRAEFDEAMGVDLANWGRL